MEDKYKVVKCKNEHGIHYEIWKNGSPHDTKWTTKFGTRMLSSKWNSYRMACRALQNMHYNNNEYFANGRNHSHELPSNETKSILEYTINN